jgi:hypothetical protein
MAPHVARVEPSTQAADATSVTARALTDCTAIPEGAGRGTAAETTSSGAATITAAAGKCAAGKRGTTENKGGYKNDHGRTQHDDLL